MKKNESFTFPFDKSSYRMMIIGVLIMALGYLLMVGGAEQDPHVFNGDEIFSFRRLTLAPVLILAGLTVEVFAIMKRPKKDPGELV